VIIPVILSGGSGRRLWPLSRATHPKQFIRFNGRGVSLLGATLRRLKADHGFSAPIIDCNNEHRFVVCEELEGAGLAPEAIILEPVARNTAPAVVATLAASRKAPEAILAVVPSDHLVKDEAEFIASLKRAATVAAGGRLVLLGIVPTGPHTGYGYIRPGRALNGAEGAFLVDAFIEKPDAAMAASYVADGGYFWNRGIFVLDARIVLGELERHAPDVLGAARAAFSGAGEDLGYERLDAVAFARAPNISIDQAVMEKTSAVAMLPLDVGWSDVGSWSSLWEAAQKDDAGNAVCGDALLIETAGCYVHSERSLVSTIGVSNLVIVDTPDALLVADKARAQEVSGVVERLRQSNRKE
jgi:mannose-1-phosphate guanylyltransferase/mannose-6-phosphate isomerase